MSTEDFNPEAPMMSYEEKVAEKFNQLVSLNVNEKTESKNGLTYLSWSNAWLEFKKVYPTATYRIIKDPQTNMPYFVDPLMGIMIFTEVEAEGLSYSMWLPVMDGANRTLKLEPYTYSVFNKTTRQYENRKVDAATMFDINKTIMRCLVKNLAMFGLGLYIYAGEDLPEDMIPETSMPTPEPAKPKRRGKINDRYEDIRQMINSARTTQELTNLYRQHENEVKNNPQILALFTARKEQLLNVA
ncbi:MAG: DUF1071 domain-containing protein [Muribaculaceae bacterium]|nr:DUF1071 domain-containing protein [Muribaculaceae bacterium]